MRNRHILLVAAGGIAASVAAGVPAWAVSTVVDGFRYNLPAGADKNLDAVRALIKASDAIGFTRRDADATMNCLGCVTPAMRYKGTGTYNGEKAEVTMDLDYRFPGVRIWVNAGGKEASYVAVKELA